MLLWQQEESFENREMRTNCLKMHSFCDMHTQTAYITESYLIVT